MHKFRYKVENVTIQELESFLNGLGELAVNYPPQILSTDGHDFVVVYLHQEEAEENHHV